MLGIGINVGAAGCPGAGFVDRDRLELLVDVLERLEHGYAAWLAAYTSGNVKRLLLAAFLIALALPAGAQAANAPKVLAIHFAAGREPGHAGLAERRARSRAVARLFGRGDPARHTGRPRGLDAEDRAEGAVAEDPGDRLRDAAGCTGRLGRRVDLRGVGRARDGARDEHRVVDPDRRQRRRTSAATSGARRSTTRPRRCAGSQSRTGATRPGRTQPCASRRT